jgi:hypothetical protein
MLNIGGKLTKRDGDDVVTLEMFLARKLCQAIHLL